MEGEFHEWACFAAQQAAEKAVKAVYQKLHGEARGHSIVELLEQLPASIQRSTELLAKAASLDLHYVTPRYPNTVPAGFPGKYYSQQQAREAIDNAEAILSFCEDNLL